MSNVWLTLFGNIGMVVVAAIAVLWWLRLTGLGWRWLWIGAGLWVVAIAVKVGVAAAFNPLLASTLHQTFSSRFAITLLGGLFLGLQSAVCEIGLTWLAGLRWPRLGENADRAIGVGVGAGAFEALLLGAAAAMGMIATLLGVEGTELVPEQIAAAAALTPLFWLAAPVERVIAVLVHASTRTLVLLGVAHRKPLMVLGGFLIFTFIDGIVGGVHASGAMRSISTWWIELMILPAAVVSVPILGWCRRSWPQGGARKYRGRSN